MATFDADGDIHNTIRKSYDTLNALIQDINTASHANRRLVVDQCLAGVSEFSDFLKEASPYLPAYDQRSYSLKIKELSERLCIARQSLIPKQKFSFKSRRNRKGNIGGDFDTKNIDLITASTPVGSDAENLAITNRVVAHIRPSFVTTTTEYSSLLLSNLNECIVTLPDLGFRSAAIKNIDRSLILLCHLVDGPVHITSITNSTLVLSCRQFRMHNATNVDIYLRCTSQPIIEDCQGIRFAPYAQSTGNLWDKVNDFKWLRCDENPHWSILPESQRYTNLELGIDDLNEANVKKHLDQVLPGSSR